MKNLHGMTGDKDTLMRAVLNECGVQGQALNAMMGNGTHPNVVATPFDAHPAAQELANIYLKPIEELDKPEVQARIQELNRQLAPKAKE